MKKIIEAIIITALIIFCSAAIRRLDCSDEAVAVSSFGENTPYEQRNITLSDLAMRMCEGVSR